MPPVPMKPVPPRPRGLVKLKDAADYLGIAPGTLKNWVAMKRIEYVKIGNRTLFRQHVLDDYIQRQTVAAVNR